MTLLVTGSISVHISGDIMKSGQSGEISEVTEFKNQITERDNDRQLDYLLQPHKEIQFLVKSQVRRKFEAWVK